MKHFFIYSFLFLLLTTTSYAACPQHFPNGQAPKLYNPKLSTNYTELCNTAYAVGHSGLTKSALWSAEFLTSQSIAAAKTLERENAFKTDTRLKPSDRSELSDYSRSGYDRGHLSPSADMPDRLSQEESFLLSNMIPQHPKNNRGIHMHIESSIRSNLRNYPNGLFIVTGPIYSGATITALNNRVLIPTNIYKCLYDPKTTASGCYLETNSSEQSYDTVSVSKINSLTGIDIFPGISASSKNSIMLLPIPKRKR